MGKIAGYLTEKRGGYDQKDAQSIGKNNGKITKQAVCKKSKQFLSSLLISLTVLEDTNSFRLVLFNGLITARLFKRL
jgi:hypothetical protein